MKKRSIIRRGSEVCYKFTNKHGKVIAGVGKVTSVDRELGVVRVLDLGVFYTVPLKNVVNSRLIFDD